ncbi:MAG: YeeE/YedE family protein, partial [Betaproteobacteria bacterium]|nr:YeeE/YedE family protein [Betaproteobacteria bacterium]
MQSSRTSYATHRAAERAQPTLAPRVQGGILASALALFALLLAATAGQGWRMPTLAALGFLIGATLYHSAFGFTAAYRRLILQRDVAGVQAQLAMVALATVLFAPVLAAGSIFGREVVGAVAPVGLQVAVGASMFGIGMQLAGGCGSGTLYTAGGGNPRMIVVLAAFCAGSFRASLDTERWENLPSWSAIALGEALGWPIAVIVQLAVVAVLWIALGRFARGQAPFAASAAPGGARILSGPWLLVAGALLLALLNFLVLIVAGHPWNITWAFALWGAKFALLFGWDPGATSFWNAEFQRSALGGGVLQDVTSVT